MYVRLFALALVTLTACQNPRPNKPTSGSGGTPENTNTLCSNGLDDNGDGNVDCDDLLCQQTAGVTVCSQGAENTSTLCSDGQDNDNDGLEDCADPECANTGCFENNDAGCSDGLDNDDDNFVDCDDFDCKYGCNVSICGDSQEKTDAQCTDGVDNDGDNHADCDDFGCQDCVAACQAGLGENTAALCTDGDDNDGDGAIDCLDVECFSLEDPIGCNTGEESTDALCTDGIDNDNDPFIDCADQDCEGVGDCTEDTLAKCADGVDNDGDGYADCQDWDCADIAPDCGESSDAECTDGFDNDSDGYSDCDDFDCKYGCAVSVCPGIEKLDAECTDNVDNDGDNHLDCDDRGCQDCAVACGAEALGEDNCTDSVDNDDDNKTDCQDVECVSVEGAGCDTGENNCTDGIDNDNDPWADCADKDCSDDTACAENTDARCSDALDNDGDSWLDCDDYDCSQAQTVTVCGGGNPKENNDSACGDSADNDSDGKTDCDDSDCSKNPALEVCPAPTATTIRRIQDPNDANHVTIPEGATQLRVKLSNVTVTTPLLTDRSGARAFFVQEVFPDDGNDTRFSGIKVHAGSATPSISIGDVIDLVGFYSEFYDNSEIRYGKHTLQAAGAAAPIATSVITQDIAPETQGEAYEGVLIRLSSVTVKATGVASTNTATFDCSVLESSAQPGLTPLIVSTNYAASEPTVGDTYGYVVGPVVYSWSKFRIAPRTESDLGNADANDEDDDSDGLSNADEATLGTDPTLADTDGDAEDDLDEVVAVATPLDSDCDAVIDALESSLLDSDGDDAADDLDYANSDGPDGDIDGDGSPNSADLNDDGDSYCDAGAGPTTGCSGSDNCQAVSNNDQKDSDGDGIGDACDADLDKDGVCNPDRCIAVAAQCTTLNDNCAEVSNVDQKDTDGDQEGDACDADDDNDLICDPGEVNTEVCDAAGGGDNCQLVANGGQQDNEGDDIGDACDADDDNDGLCDAGVQAGTEGCAWYAGHADNCPFVHNADQNDSNGNGVGNACEGQGTAPVVGEFLINEVFTDPYLGAGVAYGDANGDGSYDSQNTEDEFIEIINVSGGERTLEGCTLSDDQQVRHTFAGDVDPSVYVVAAKGGVVVFGGGTPTGTFGGSTVVVASTGKLQLNNKSPGDSVTLTCGDVTVASMTYTGKDGDKDQSLQLNVDGDATSGYELHGGEPPYSPGTCRNGIVFSTCL